MGWSQTVTCLDCSGELLSGSTKNQVWYWFSCGSTFFHIALYHTTIALTVSSSYFQGDLAEHHLCPSVGGCFGAPMVVSLGNIFRYHLGSLAFGSFALMLCTVARVVFEYVERHTKERKSDEFQQLLKRGLGDLGCSCVCCQSSAVTAIRTQG